jgi:hypothetical protein
VSKLEKSVIPGEPNDCGRDPESRKLAENEIILDPGSRPASVFAEASPDTPRDLAGMTNYDTASRGREIKGGVSWHIVMKNQWKGELEHGHLLPAIAKI